MGMYQGGFIGGMHFPPGTDIIINKTPLKLLIEQKPYDIVRAYTYHILLYLYVHALGYLKKDKCREITLRITEKVYTKYHPAVIMAKKGIGAYFPNLNLIYAPDNLRSDRIRIEYINKFDKESYEYYS